MDVAAPAQRCGTMVGCALDRNEAIDGTVETTYTPGSSDYAPPEPPHDNGADPISPIGTWMHAEATAWFARPGSGEAQTIRNTDQPGSCGITSRDLMIMAIPTPQFGQNANPAADVWNLAYWCGACAEVVGPSGKRARVQIVTQRAYDDDGNYYSIDLPANGDNQVDTPYSMIDSGQLCSIGLPVDWRIVPCEVCGGIVLSYTPGFNTGTPAFRILNHRLPIVDAYYMNSSGTWQRIQRDSVNQYHTGQANPMRLRVIAIDGSTIEGSFPAYSAGKSYEATSQF
jgi:expansin (peptidoglycan-binding protein)